MTAESVGSTTQQQAATIRVTSPTRTADELPNRGVSAAIFERDQPMLTPAPEHSLTATFAEALTSSPTLAGHRRAVPSVDDALSTSFIDARTVGIETWPIRGLQTWEGKVVEVGDDIFTAELTPSGDEAQGVVLRADFRNDVLDVDDRGIVPGDLFYMTARKMRSRGRLGTSYSLQIRRPGNWTDADLSEIRARTRTRIELLDENAE